jgi:hypothetical protein
MVPELWSLLADSFFDLGRFDALAADAEKLYRAAPPGEMGDRLRNLVAWRKQHARTR